MKIYQLNDPSGESIGLLGVDYENKPDASWDKEANIKKMDNDVAATAKEAGLLDDTDEVFTYLIGSLELLKYDAERLFVDEIQL